MIFADVLRSTAPGHAVWQPRDRYGDSRNRYGDAEEQILPGLPLLSTNKQIHAEALPMLTKDNVYNISFFLANMSNAKIPDRYHKAFSTFRKFRIYIQTCLFEINSENGRARINIETMCASLAVLLGRLHAEQYHNDENEPTVEVELVFDGDERMFTKAELGMSEQTIFTYGQTFDTSYDPLLRYKLFFVWAQLDASLPHCHQVFAEQAPLVVLSVHPDIVNLPEGVELERLSGKEVAFVDRVKEERGVIRLERKYVGWIRIRWEVY